MSCSRRRRLGAGAAALRARLARGLRRLDDGRARGGLAHGRALADALVLGAAAGAANFLRHGLGTGSRAGRRGARAAARRAARLRLARTAAARPRRSPRGALARSSRRGRAPPSPAAPARASSHRPPAARRVRVAAQHVHRARAGASRDRLRGRAAFRARPSPGPARPRHEVRRAARSPARGGAPGGRSRCGSPRSARSVHARRQASRTAGPGAGSSRIQRRRRRARRARSSVVGRARSTIVSATSPPGSDAHRDAGARASAALQRRDAPASSAIRTSWSWRMCGVAQIVSIPSAAACARHRDAVVEVEPRRRRVPGRMWQWRSITAGATLRKITVRSGSSRRWRADAGRHSLAPMPKPPTRRARSESSSPGPVSPVSKTLIALASWLSDRVAVTLVSRRRAFAYRGRSRCRGVRRAGGRGLSGAAIALRLRGRLVADSGRAGSRAPSACSSQVATSSSTTRSWSRSAHAASRHGPGYSHSGAPRRPRTQDAGGGGRPR